MRVIAGTYRSRIIEEVGTELTRETKDRVKESVFNSITSHLAEAVVLDLFAGSGSLGIEAISRGSSHCDFVDNQHQAYQTITNNVLALKIQHQSYITQQEYTTFLQTTNKSYDIIFLDPPYKMDVLDSIVSLIAIRNLLSKSGVIVCLYDKLNQIKEENNGIIVDKKKTIGITNVSYLKWGI